MTVAPSPTQAISLNALVQAAAQIWVRRLIDYSRANSLLFYRDLAVGTLDLTPYNGALEKLLAGESITVDQLLDLRSRPPQRDPVARQRADDELRQKLRTVFVAQRRKALANQEEKGIQTLYLAIGMATWPATDGGRPYNSPVTLIPAWLEAKGRSGEKLQLVVRGEPRINPVLLYVLEESHDIRVDAAALLKKASEEDERGHWRIDSERILTALEEAAACISEFTVQRRHVVANFQFAKMAMVEDLKKNQDAMASSPLIAAIAGHTASRQSLAQASVEVEPRHLDEMPSSDDFLVLDADSTQHRAIVAIGKGMNCVVQGPPGTGKSQTIANLIAQTVADGKRVLFVAEKRAALDAVIKRLSHPDVGLGHLILDLHGASVSRKEVMAKLAETLEAIRHSLPIEGAENVCREFDVQRKRLNAHARAINATRAPTGLSLNGIIGKLLRLPKAASSPLRLRGESFARLTTERADELRQLLRECAAQRPLLFGEDQSPWAAATLKTGEQAQQAADLAAKISRDLLPKLEDLLADWAKRAGVSAPKTFDGAIKLAQLLQETHEYRQGYDPEIFNLNPGRLAKALGPAQRGLLPSLWALLTDREYRHARWQMLQLATMKRPTSELHAGAKQAAGIALRWKTAGSAQGVPDPSSAASLFRCLQQLVVSGKQFRKATGIEPLKSRVLADARDSLEKLAADKRTPYQLPHVHELRQKIHEHGLDAILDEIRSQRLPESLWPSRFEYIWLYSALEHVLATEPALSSFSGNTHEHLVQEFRRLDRERIRLAAGRVRRLHAERAIEARNRHFDQANLVQTEARKKARHMPLRDLLSRAPEVLTRIAPCWIASPLSVSQLLDGERRHFDIVIFDEASQILQEEAVPALLRAEQVVVAGDRHQLPPTTFFATAVDGQDTSEEEQVSAAAAITATEAVGGFESLLGTLDAFLPNYLLEWHYRSEDERLISFSNENIYDGRLVTFPTARNYQAIRHVLVPHDRAAGGQEESASREVEEVVRLVLEHADTRPEESLGVIAMGMKHANRVQAALDRALESRPDLADFCSLDRDDRFFVKNLETVQGDERDAIILTIGYGKNANGDLPHRFGPLTHEAGHRRLNVAITRARRRMTVVSSFSHNEVDLARSGSKGVALLKAYLDYAASGGTRLPQMEVAGQVPLNAFEADIRDALEVAGIHTRPQFGASRYRIDLVAMHPQQQGRPVLAIECDGATYHSSATARDRDRLRQSHLQRLGWRFHRIWSTDWFFNRESEVQRLVAAYHEAVRKADEGVAEELSVDKQMQQTAPKAINAAVEDEGPQRGPKPRVRQKNSIDDYSDHELCALAKWITSDGQLRTDEELVECLFNELPFKRRGSRIRVRLERVAQSMRQL